jgi:hypothetical protein
MLDRRLTFLLAGTMLLLLLVGVLLLALLTITQAVSLRLEPTYWELVESSEKIYHPLEDGWQRIELGTFSIHTPDSYRLVKATQPFDSFVGQLTDQVDTLFFDFGWYSNSLSGPYEVEMLVAQDTVAGKKIRLLQPKVAGTGFFGAYFSQVDEQNRFVITSHDMLDHALFLKMIGSIRFEGANDSIEETTLSPTYRFLSNIFSTHCSSCHQMDNRNLVGPGLGEMSRSDYHAWFLDKWPNWQPKDSSMFFYGPEFHQEYVKRFGKEAILETWEEIQEHQILRVVY